MSKYNIMEIKSKLTLPYDIINIRKGTLYDGNIIEFKIRLCEIPQNQTKESIKIDIDQSYCYEWLENFKTVFKELERIQGDDKY